MTTEIIRNVTICPSTCTQSLRNLVPRVSLLPASLSLQGTENEERAWEGGWSLRPNESLVLEYQPRSLGTRLLDYSNDARLLAFHWFSLILIQHPTFLQRYADKKRNNKRKLFNDHDLSLHVSELSFGVGSGTWELGNS